MKEPTYSVKVEIEGKESAIEYTNVLFDGIDGDKPFFYCFRFEDSTQKNFPVHRILSLEYGKDKAECIDYWKKQYKQG